MRQQDLMDFDVHIIFLFILSSRLFHCLPTQRKWLERLAKQIVHEVIVDREFVNNRFADHGGAKQLDKMPPIS